jgi:hypothetical protein
LLEVASHLDEVSLVLLCFTSHLTKETVLHFCKARKRNLVLKDNACEYASGRGQLPALLWLSQNNCFLPKRHCFVAAVKGDHLDTLKWLYEVTPPNLDLEVVICHTAVTHGKATIMRWLMDSRGVIGTRDLCAMAAKYGHLDLLKLMREKWYPWDSSTCSQAARRGHLHILQWVREKGCPWDDQTVYEAAVDGHLDLLKWARRNGCPMDQDVCYTAARYGQIEVLKWAREDGQLYKEELLVRRARYFDRHAMAEWIEANPF